MILSFLFLNIAIVVLALVAFGAGKADQRLSTLKQISTRMDILCKVSRADNLSQEAVMKLRGQIEALHYISNGIGNDMKKDPMFKMMTKRKK